MSSIIPYGSLSNINENNEIQKGPPDLSWLDDLKTISLSTESRLSIESRLTKENKERVSLEGMNLSCPTHVEAGRWKNRIEFIKAVVTDLLLTCPKDKPIALISTGSALLLMEYLIGKALIENGFSKLSFFLIDPFYSEDEEKETYESAFADFQTFLNKVNGENFPKERIHKLSRVQNLPEHFPSETNVVWIESLPPCSKIISDIKGYRMEEKTRDELLVGSAICSSSDQANAIAFIPQNYFKDEDVKFESKLKNLNSIPFIPFETSSEKYYYIDWGCKIFSDWTYSLIFSGEQDWCQNYNLDDDLFILPSEDEITNGWVPETKKAIEEELDKQIEEMKLKDSQTEFNQENRKILLEKIKKVAKDYIKGVQCFFLSDYAVDRKDLVSVLSSQKNREYSKVWTLDADPGYKGYKISSNNIE
jgi:hypothetical protein